MAQETPLDTSLRPDLEAQIQPRSLGLIQNEIGVLTTNLFMTQARVEALMTQRALDVALIDGLKKRAFKAEEDVAILQNQLREALEKAPTPRKRRTL